MAFGLCYFGRGAQPPHEPWAFYQGQSVCGRLLLVFLPLRILSSLPQLPWVLQVIGIVDLIALAASGIRRFRNSLDFQGAACALGSYQGHF